MVLKKTEINARGQTQKELKTALNPDFTSSDIISSSKSTVLSLPI